MSLEELHEVATLNSPNNVDVPATWSGIVVWALTKWGIGILGFLMLVPVYLDLKSSNERFEKITEANIRVVTVFSERVQANSERLERLDQTLQRQLSSK